MVNAVHQPSRPRTRQTAVWRRTMAAAVAGMALAGHAGMAQSQDGQGMAWTRADGAPMWPHWEGRIGVVLDHAADNRRSSFALGTPAGNGLKLHSAHALSDYYFGGGFRATAGLVRGRTNLPWWSGAGHSSSGLNLMLENWSAADLPSSSSGVLRDDTDRTVAYVGAGYRGQLNEAKAYGYGAWHFNADLGLISLNSNNIGRLGRVLQGDQGVDELLRDLRLRPVLKVRVDYAF